MNLKTFILIIIGISVFLGIYLFNMISAFTLLFGFGLGIWQHKYIGDIFKNFQKGIYLSEKANIVNRKKELQDELERLTHGD